MQKLKIILIFISLVASKFSYSQIYSENVDSIYSWEFFTYLKNNSLNNEALTWLKTYPIQRTDTALKNKIYTETALLFLKENKLDSSNFYFKKNYDFIDTNTLLLAIETAIIVKDSNAVEKYLSKYDNQINKQNEMEFTIILQIFEKKPQTDTIYLSQISNDLQKIVNKYNSFKKKSTFKAGVLSALVPGLGKIYLGYKHQAQASFIVNTSLLATIIESAYITTSPINLYVSIPLFTLFYGGNIVGTVLLTKKRQNDFINQINEDISNYYLSNSLYNK